jgi:HlyD family secretion protein
MAHAKVRRILFVLLFVIVAAGAVAFRFRSQPVSIIVRAVDRGQVAKTVTNTRAGTIKACRRSKLSLPGGGQIAHLYVHKGDRVKAGQPMLELWNADISANLKVFEEQLQSAQWQANETCARAELASRDARRATDLHKDALIPEEQYDKVTSEAAMLHTRCEQAKADIAYSSARIKQAKAELERTMLYAPYNGRVADITGELGEFTTPSPPGIPTPPAVDLIDDSCYYVSVPVDEVESGSVRVGMPAEISIDAFPGEKFSGRVRRIAPYALEIEKQARTVEMEVEFTPVPDKDLVVGYSADVEITPEARLDVVRVPTSAILQGNRVLVYQPAKKLLESRSLVTGLSNWEFTEVKSGINAGDLIVVSLDRPGVKEGARASIEKAGAQP